MVAHLEKAMSSWRTQREAIVLALGLLFFLTAGLEVDADEGSQLLRETENCLPAGLWEAPPLDFSSSHRGPEVVKQIIPIPRVEMKAGG